MPDPLGAIARGLRCSRGQAATALLGLLIALPTLVATVVGVNRGPIDSPGPRPQTSIAPLEKP